MDGVNKTLYIPLFAGKLAKKIYRLYEYESETPLT